MSSIKKEVPILMCNRPTINGRTYTKEEVEKAISEIKTPQLLGMIGPAEGLNIDLNDVAYVVENFKFNDYNCLVADVRTLDTPKGRVIDPILDLCEFTTVGTGEVGLDGVISKFSISYISANLKPSS